MSEKIDPSKKFGLRVDLQPEIAAMLKEIMEERKFQYYANAIRYCIVETYNQNEYSLEEPYLERIHKYLDQKYIKQMHLLSSTQQFINKALEYYFDHIESNKPSLFDFNVRDELTKEQLEIALAIIQCQEKSPTQMITLNEVANFLNFRNRKKLEAIFEDFELEGLIQRTSIDGKTFYHANKSKEV